MCDFQCRVVTFMGQTCAEVSWAQAQKGVKMLSEARLPVHMTHVHRYILVSAMHPNTCGAVLLFAKVTFCGTRSGTSVYMQELRSFG